jgi:hypothetical protein
MKEPTYSVFVRFRRGQRLTLKRSAPLDVALRFASTVRGERFHNPDDVFIVDDASGDPICEASIAKGGAIETVSETPPVSDVQRSASGPRDDIGTAHTYAAPWQFRQAHVILRGGQRLISSAEQSLGQVTRAMEQLRRWIMLDTEVGSILSNLAQAGEQVRKVHDELRRVEEQLANTPLKKELNGGKGPEEPGALPPLPAPLNAAVTRGPQARKKQARAKH